MTEYFRLTATQALALIREDKLSVEEYARSLLERINARNEHVKAWAYINPELVLAQAQVLDKLPKEQRGPLHGIAIGVKDVMYTKDMPTQHNSPIYKDHAPAVDAGPVMILRSSGALIFGKTTTTVFASVTVGPDTMNPHDPKCTPGGSSSGSAAAVGDMQVPLSLGTQTVGSTIRPASFNGVFGLKPTWGAISREGLKVYSLNLDTLGIFARSVADLQLLADVFHLSDDQIPPPFVIKGAKFATCKTHIWPEAGPGTVEAMRKAVDLLKTEGAEVEELELPSEFSDMKTLGVCMMQGDGGVSFLGEYLTSKDKLLEDLVGLVENSSGFSRQQHLEAMDRIAALRPVIDSIARPYAAIITPSAVDEAPEGLASTGSPAFNAMWTALHLPVINIPGFKGANGMPIGLSLVAPRYHDRHLLNVAEEVANVFAIGGWQSSL